MAAIVVHDDLLGLRGRLNLSAAKQDSSSGELFSGRIEHNFGIEEGALEFTDARAKTGLTEFSKFNRHGSSRPFLLPWTRTAA